MLPRHVALSLIVAVVACSVSACNRAPNREEALAALRANAPGLDTTIVHVRVWQDGPAWFACSEVIAKFTSPVDASAVRDDVGNWKPLVVSGWLVLRDSSAGVVSDPGWCTAKLAGASGAAGVAARSSALIADSRGRPQTSGRRLDSHPLHVTKAGPSRKS